MREVLYGLPLRIFSRLFVAAQPPQAKPDAATPKAISDERLARGALCDVREGKTGFVGDLTKDNFVVKEDGKLQEIRQFSRDDVPVAVGLVIDNSQSMLNKRDEVVAAGKAFVRASNPSDEMFVVHFNEKITFGLPTNRMFSSNREELDRALDLTSLQGHTALYDAIQVALDHLKKSTLTKRALFVISDGGDNHSASKMKDVVKAADLSGALFYAIGIYDAMDGDANPGHCRGWLRRQVGRHFFRRAWKKSVLFVNPLRAICETSTRSYTRLRTVRTTPAYHRVEVSVKDPQRRKLKVTSRSGYYGSAAPARKPGKADKNETASALRRRCFLLRLGAGCVRSPRRRDNPGALSDAEKEAFLLKGTIISTKAIDHGVTKPQRATLSDGKLKHDAQIQVVNRELPPFIRDGQGLSEFRPLEAQRRGVQDGSPPAAEHGACVRGTEARRLPRQSFTWWVDDVMMEEVARRKKELQAPDPEAFTRQHGAGQSL